VEVRPTLLALGVLILGFVVGAVVLALGHAIFAILLGAAAVPIALVVWVVAADGS
jgi:hypothetical protein